ncbi:flotillin family protein [Clostridium butyricum]|uniref:flotillin family protein n=1 Tax=Clostridium butyricum TaxID=1492 RepID=UPI00129B7123|nr:SPFH domain-containing protein [Clostridium butyricum]MDU1336885.1 SPFH domain-containing protein [Clostridium butyricum]QGH21369.1 flotillin [Clostridium butyricum]QGH25405.1 flotillin [Clostridium butyricum]
MLLVDILLHNLIFIFILILIIAVILFWRKVPADKAMVITGLKKRVLTGKGGFIVPFFETSCIVSLENISMTTDVKEAPSQQGIFVDVTGTAVVKVENKIESIYKAVEQFCNGNAKNTTDVIRAMVEPVLEGRLRGIVSTMTVEQINNDRYAFEKKVEEDIKRELNEMGLQLISYSILQISTQGGYLENRARPQVAQSKADAEVAEAERKRDTDIKTAEAVREGQKVKLAADAEVASAERDKRIKVEQYRAEQDKAKAEADIAYSLKEIEKQSEVEKQKAILAEQEAIRVEKELVAKVEKPANAEKRKIEIYAEAQKVQSIKEAEAEAEKIRIEALAKAEARKIEALADAEAIKARGEAEALSIKAKGIAEAEAKDRLADAMAKYGEAAIVEMLISKLPEIMSEISKPMSNIDKITVIDTGSNSNSTSKIPKTVTDVAGSGFEVINDLTGIDISEVIKSFIKKNSSNPNNTPNNDKKVDVKDFIDIFKNVVSSKNTTDTSTHDK